jgi:hypothetical protein
MRRTPYTQRGLKRLEGNTSAIIVGANYQCCRCRAHMAAYQQFSPVTQRWYPICVNCFKFLQRIIFMFVDSDGYADKEDALMTYFDSLD